MIDCMLESKAAILFRHWLKANPQYTCAYELKQTEGDSLPFKAVEQHQLDYLEAINGSKGVLVRVQGVNGEPDYVYLRNCPACIVIKYPKAFHVLSVNAFLWERENSKRKSLTEERARKIAVQSVELR
jgi:penicillin-binding protein-related factor A (putative recombinase)